MVFCSEKGCTLKGGKEEKYLLGGAGKTQTGNT
jgi:hypothetical protein